MASEWEYLEKVTTGQLEYFLEQELSGRGQYGLDTLYLICTILSERNPGHGSNKEVFLRFCEAFADKKIRPLSFRSEVFADSEKITSELPQQRQPRKRSCWLYCIFW